MVFTWFYLVLYDSCRDLADGREVPGGHEVSELTENLERCFVLASGHELARGRELAGGRELAEGPENPK